MRPDKFTQRLGARWTVEELSFKPYPACRWVHAALEAAEHLMREGNLGAADIREVEVGTFADVVVNFAERRPKTMVDAEFSLPWTMAVTIAGLPKGPQWYSDTPFERPCDPHHRRQSAHGRRSRGAGPPFQRRAQIDVGRPHDDFGRLPSRAPRCRSARRLASPWPKGGIEAKFHSLADPVIGEEAARELRRRILLLGEGEPVDPLYALIGGHTTGSPDDGARIRSIQDRRFRARNWIRDPGTCEHRDHQASTASAQQRHGRKTMSSAANLTGSFLRRRGSDREAGSWSSLPRRPIPEARAPVQGLYLCRSRPCGDAGRDGDPAEGERRSPDRGAASNPWHGRKELPVATRFGVVSHPCGALADRTLGANIAGLLQTGRSRNDQDAAAERFFQRELILDLSEALSRLLSLTLDLASAMPKR